MSKRWSCLLVLFATGGGSGTARSEARTGRPGGWEGYVSCRPVGSDCTGHGLRLLTEQEWSATEIASFAARAARGTTAVDRGPKGVSMVADCSLDGRYHEIGGKPGSGRLWVTNRPLFRVDEIGPSCARATHVVAAFARKGRRFQAILVPLPCPSVADKKPAPGCVGRGLTGAERLQKSKALQARIEPVKVVPRNQKERKRMLLTGELDILRKPDIPSDGWLLDMWALAPDEYPAVRWLSEVKKDCSLAAQGGWLASCYSKDSAPGAPAKPSSHSPPPLKMHLDYGWRPECEGRPVLLTCFPALFQPAVDSICHPTN